MNNRAAKFYLDAGAVRGEQQRTVKGRGGFVWPSASIRSFRFATSLDGKHQPRSVRRCPCRYCDDNALYCPAWPKYRRGALSSCCRRRARPRRYPGCNRPPQVGLCGCAAQCSRQARWSARAFAIAALPGLEFRARARPPSSCVAVKPLLPFGASSAKALAVPQFSIAETRMAKPTDRVCIVSST